ncbi:hypothetical protein KBA41_15050, partial [Candidatus Ozemobacteraceae bacterium]|nr:hypothetical protein [Candidatus Ozemobacteraceae bacterium]
PWSWRTVLWSRELAGHLEEWFAVCDERNDIELFRRLYQWKLIPTRGWKTDTKPLVADLLRRLTDAAAPAREAVWSSDSWHAAGDLLDPVVTVHPDGLVFEAFSQDQSSYVQVKADAGLFEPDVEVRHGTTKHRLHRLALGGPGRDPHLPRNLVPYRQ